MISVILLKKKTKTAMMKLTTRHRNILKKSSVVDKNEGLPGKIDVLYIENGVNPEKVKGYTPLFYKRIESINLDRSKTKMVGKVTKMEKI